jgi:fermentation-respiration switch protein FrsA (DUF1100 family)
LTAPGSISKVGIAPRDGRASARKSLGALFCVISLLPACVSTPGPPSSEAASSSSISQIYETGPTRIFDAGFQERPFTDRSRKTPPTDGQEEKPFRRLETTFFYPIKKGMKGVATANLIPKQAALLPLVVFAHGLGAPVSGYRGLFLNIAGAGFVVAAPQFPDPGPDRDAGIADAENHPGDVTFLLNELELLASRGDNFAASILTSRAALAGHSLGAGTVFKSGFSSCCRDQRVTAGLAFGTARVSLLGLAEFPPGFPLLLIQGSKDDVATATNVYMRAKSPKLLLILGGSDHSQPFMYMSSPPDPDERLTGDVSVLFLNATLKGQADGYSRISALVEEYGPAGSLQAEL